MRRYWMIALAVLVWTGCKAGQHPEPTAQPEADRVIHITVGDMGYEPSLVETKAGEPITLKFTRTTSSPCLEEVVLPHENVRKTLPMNEAVAITFTPRAPGRLRFTCGMDMFEGAIVVQ